MLIRRQVTIILAYHFLSLFGTVEAAINFAHLRVGFSAKNSSF